MCRTEVTVDAQGRCPLGHAVVDPDELDPVALDTGVADDDAQPQETTAASTPPAAAFSIPARPASGTHGAAGAHERTDGRRRRTGRHAAPPQDDSSRADEDVVAVYREPTAGHVSVQPSMDARPTFGDPEGAPAIGPDDHQSHGGASTSPGLQLPTRLTKPIGPAPDTHTVLTEDLDDDLVRAHADNAAAFAAMVTAELAEVPLPTYTPPEQEDDGRTPPVGIPVADLPAPDPSAPDLVAPTRPTRTDRLLGTDHPSTAPPQPEGLPDGQPDSVLTDPAGSPARVPHTDLTPGAPSSLDVHDLPPPDTTPERQFEQWPMDADEAELEPDRTWAQRLLGAVFIALLLGLAWWLATSL